MVRFIGNVMAETLGSGDAPDDDETLRYIQDVINTLNADDSTSLHLNASAAEILESTEPSRGYDEARDEFGGLSRRKLDAAIYRTMANGYLISAHAAVGHLREYLGRQPGERTGRDQCLQFARDIFNTQLDISIDEFAELRSRPGVGPGESRELLMRQRQLEHTAIWHALSAYGVREEDIRVITGRRNGMRTIFSTNGSYVRINVQGKTLRVVAWGGELSLSQQSEAYANYDALLMAGVPLTYLRQYANEGNIPLQLQELESRIQADRAEINAAYDEHFQRVRAHVRATGLRSFQIQSPALRWGLPVAMHILEQSPDEVYDIIGPLSPVHGHLVVSSPGHFRRAGSAQYADWMVTADGGIDAV
jgi:hypothetical protein